MTLPVATDLVDGLLDIDVALQANVSSSSAGGRAGALPTSGWTSRVFERFSTMFVQTLAFGFVATASTLA